MDQNLNNTPITENSPATPVNGAPNGDMGTNGHKKVGPIIATLVIILILIIAALYVFASRANQQAIPDDGSMSAVSDGSSSTQTGASATVAPVTGTSTDLQSLQHDLDAATRGVDQQNF